MDTYTSPTLSLESHADISVKRFNSIIKFAGCFAISLVVNFIFHIFSLNGDQTALDLLFVSYPMYVPIFMILFFLEIFSKKGIMHDFGFSILVISIANPVALSASYFCLKSGIFEGM